MHSSPRIAYLLSIIKACSSEAGWGLEPVECQLYAETLNRLLDSSADEAQIRLCALYYHSEHRRVIALRDAHDPAHGQAWDAWAAQAIAVLRSAGLDWSSDAAIDAEDLAQIARVELVRALPSYRYQSRLSSWAYRVVVQAVQRHLRDSQAAKRAVRPASLDQLGEPEQQAAEQHDPELVARATALADLVGRTLTAQPDGRLTTIFQLWAVEDRRVTEIGAQVGLHPSRVRALLQHCREMLRNSPAIRDWVAADH